MLEQGFWLGMLAGIVCSSGNLAATIKCIRDKNVSSYSNYFIVAQFFGCLLYVVYEVPINAYAAAFWTLISALCIGVIGYYKIVLPLYKELWFKASAWRMQVSAEYSNKIEERQ